MQLSDTATAPFHCSATIGTVAAQSVQHVVVNAMMRKLQPRMQKLCDVKTAALLHYAAAAYLRLAEAAVPKQTSAGI